MQAVPCTPSDQESILHMYSVHPRHLRISTTITIPDHECLWKRGIPSYPNHIRNSVRPRKAERECNRISNQSPYEPVKEIYPPYLIDMNIIYLFSKE